MKNAVFLILIASFLFMAGDCQQRNPPPPPPPQPDAEIVSKISDDLNGRANDEDSATNPSPASYRGVGKATDSECEGQSFAAKKDEVSGKAKAVSTDPTANTLTGDEARASSNNKVVSKFVINNQSRPTFDLKLDVSKVELVHDGKAMISVRANILTAQGTTPPASANAAISFLDLEFERDGTNPLKITINSDSTNTDAAQANGDYSRTISGPNGGVNLPPGNYQLEMDLRIRTTAPILFGPDGNKHSAKVDKATLTIKLR